MQQRFEKEAGGGLNPPQMQFSEKGNLVKRAWPINQIKLNLNLGSVPFSKYRSLANNFIFYKVRIYVHRERRLKSRYSE